jgi:hypothetical protein
MTAPWGTQGGQSEICSAAEGFDQCFFLFLGELGERVEGGEIAAEPGGGEASEGFG